jgi:hypothetical protein
MALFIRQSEDRSKLQERLAAELQEKAKMRAAKADEVDGVEDSQYLKDTKSTTSLAWVWLVIIAAFVFVAIMFMIQAM